MNRGTNWFRIFSIAFIIGLTSLLHSNLVSTKIQKIVKYKNRNLDVKINFTFTKFI